MDNMEIDVKVMPEESENRYLNVIDAGVYMYDMTNHTIIRKSQINNYHIVYITNGYCDVTVKKNTVRIEKGNIMIFKPGEEKIYTLYATEQTEAYWIDFSGKETEDLLIRAGISDAMFYNVGLNKKIVDLFHEMSVEKRFGNYLHEIALESMLMNLICMIGRQVKKVNQVNNRFALPEQPAKVKKNAEEDTFLQEEQYDFVFNRFVRKWFDGEIDKEILMWNLNFYQVEYLYPWFFAAYIKSVRKIDIKRVKNVIACEKNEDEWEYLIFVEDERNYSETVFELLKSAQCIKLGMSGLFESIYDVPQAFKNAIEAYNAAEKGRCSWYIEGEDENDTFIVQKAIFELRKSYNEQVSSRTIAEKLYVSDSYLRKIFKKEVGMSIHKYLTAFRIKRAAQLILMGKYTIEEIVEMVGYKDVKYFRKVFVEVMGVTPGEYGKGERKKI